jgi:hypothetical protein
MIGVVVVVAVAVAVVIAAWFRCGRGVRRGRWPGVEGKKDGIRL